MFKLCSPYVDHPSATLLCLPPHHVLEASITASPATECAVLCVISVEQPATLQRERWSEIHLLNSDTHFFHSLQASNYGTIGYELYRHSKRSYHAYGTLGSNWLSAKQKNLITTLGLRRRVNKYEIQLVSNTSSPTHYKGHPLLTKHYCKIFTTSFQTVQKVTIPTWLIITLLQSFLIAIARSCQVHVWLWYSSTGSLNRKSVMFNMCFSLWLWQNNDFMLSQL